MEAGLCASGNSEVNLALEAPPRVGWGRVLVWGEGGKEQPLEARLGPELELICTRGQSLLQPRRVCLVPLTPKPSPGLVSQLPFPVQLTRPPLSAGGGAYYVP